MNLKKKPLNKSMIAFIKIVDLNFAYQIYFSWLCLIYPHLLLPPWKKASERVRCLWNICE